MKTKFRVWNEKTESFINYGDLMLDLKNGKVYSGDVGIPEYTIDVTNQVVLMQSTGLKDKNGVEIFEGDIVEYFHTPAVIQKVKGGFAIVNTSDYEYMTNLNGHIRILGNIYENYELMEVVD